MNRTLRACTAPSLPGPIWSPSIACAALFGCLQHERAGQGAGNVEYRGRYAKESNM